MKFKPGDKITAATGNTLSPNNFWYVLVYKTNKYTYVIAHENEDRQQLQDWSIPQTDKLFRKLTPIELLLYG